MLGSFFKKLIGIKEQNGVLSKTKVAYNATATETMPAGEDNKSHPSWYVTKRVDKTTTGSNEKEGVKGAKIFVMETASKHSFQSVEKQYKDKAISRSATIAIDFCIKKDIKVQ